MIYDWPLLKQTSKGREFKNLILRIIELNEKKFSLLRSNSLPVSMDRESLEKRACDLGILIFETDTDDSLRERIVMADFWWTSGGTLGHMRRVLSFLMKGDQRSSWDYVSARDTRFEIGIAEIARSQIGDLGSISFKLKNPSPAQIRDVNLYLNWAVAPYLEYTIEKVEDL